jgi:hypothetical protein
MEWIPSNILGQILIRNFDHPYIILVNFYHISKVQIIHAVKILNVVFTKEFILFKASVCCFSLTYRARAHTHAFYNTFNCRLCDFSSTLDSVTLFI